MMFPRLLFQSRTSFLKDDVSSSFGEEEDAEHPAEASSAELNPVTDAWK
jgi:hypothetical protein